MADEIEIRDIREPGWMWAQHEVLELGPAIGTSGVAVYMALCRHANRQQKSWPSAAGIAAMLGIERKTVLGALQRIEDVGMVRVERRAGCKSTYHLLDLVAVLKTYRSEKRTGPTDGPGQSEKRTAPSPKNGPEEETGTRTIEDPLAGDGLLPLEPSPTSVADAAASDSSPTPPKPPSPSRTGRRGSQPGDPRVTPVLARFAQRFREKTGEEFVPTYKRDGGIIRSLPARLDTAKLEALVDEYFRTADAWVKQHGYDVPTFRSRLNALMAAGKAKMQERRAESLSDRLAREDAERMGVTA